MLFKTLFSVFSLVAAVPAAAASPRTACPAGSRHSSSPTLPKNGGPKELTNPPAGLKLLDIALGLGIQNYSCAGDGASPVPIGAKAMLWDARPLFPKLGPESLGSLADFDAFPGHILEKRAGVFKKLLTKSSNSSNESSSPQDSSSSSSSSSFPPAGNLYLAAHEGFFSPPKNVDLLFLGHHFFDAAGVPNFVLYEKGIKNYGDPLSAPISRLAVKKDEAVDAPTAANPGPESTGAVGWLKLSVLSGTTTNPSSSPQAKLVYRVLTAGGKTHGCRAAGVDSTEYAATYWFFG